MYKSQHSCVQNWTYKIIFQLSTFEKSLKVLKDQYIVIYFKMDANIFRNHIWILYIHLGLSGVVV